MSADAAGNTIYVDVSPLDSVAVVCVGLIKNDWSWYSNGSLIKIGDKYYPYGTDNNLELYYNYDDNKVYHLLNGSYIAYRLNPTVFDQVPSDFLTILASGDFTLVPDT